MSIRVIVIGGASYGNRAHVYRTLDTLNSAVPFLMLIESVRRKTWAGRLVGAAYYAGRWAADRGVIHVSDIPGPMDHLGGFRRAIANHRPDIVVRFPGGKLTHALAAICVENRLQIVEAL